MISKEKALESIQEIVISYAKAIEEMYFIGTFNYKNIENLKGIPFLIPGSSRIGLNQHLTATDKLMLVAGLSHFDSFLTNMTKLAFLKNTSKLIGDTTIQASMLLSKTRANIINDLFNKKISEISRKNFFDRIEILRGVTGQKIKISEFEKKVLSRLSRQRNWVVHEQQNAFFTVNENFTVETNFQQEELREKMNRFEFDVPEYIALRLYIDVFKYVVERDPEGLEMNVVTTFEKGFHYNVKVGMSENSYVEEGG